MSRATVAAASHLQLLVLALGFVDLKGYSGHHLVLTGYSQGTIQSTDLHLELLVLPLGLVDLLAKLFGVLAHRHLYESTHGRVSPAD
jgi:hypothetical protein